MINAGMAFWGAGGENFLAGNARVYDGSFDYDQLSPLVPIIRPFLPSAVLITLKPSAVGAFAKGTVLGFGDTLSGSIRQGFKLFIGAQYQNIELDLGAFSNIAVYTLTINTPPSVGDVVTMILIKPDLSVSSPSLYFNGTLQTGLSSVGTAQDYTTLFPATANIATSRDGFGGNYLQSIVKRLEVIDFIPDASQIASASSGGSFLAAGVDAANFLLSVDYDKQNGESPTDINSNFTITAQGGSVYQNFE